MTREPRIPMRPEDLPQQRIHEVVGLPERPAEFNFEVGYGCSPEGGLPKAGISSATFLCQVEWAWSPMHSRIDAYYLHRGRSEWSLWSKYWDDNWGKWEHIGIGNHGQSTTNTGHLQPKKPMMARAVGNLPPFFFGRYSNLA